MSDPHVKALIYFVDPNDSVDYGDAKPIEFERPGFHVRLEDGRARFDLTEHYPTEQEARALVQPVIDQWTFEASTKSGQNNFNLRFGWPEIIDRQPDPPTPGIISISAHFPGAPGSITAAVRVTRQYPPPPSEDEMDIHDPDVQTMLHRFMRYRQGHEPLSSMAYFCLTMLEYRFKSNSRAKAAEHFHVDRDILDNIGLLTGDRAGKGGRRARKAIDGKGTPEDFASEEKRFLEAAISCLILQSARVAAPMESDIPTITMADLPALPAK